VIENRASCGDLFEKRRRLMQQWAAFCTACDREFIEKYGLGRVPPGRRRRRQFITSGYLVEATSVDALAGKIGVDAAGLRETVRQHNRFAENLQSLARPHVPFQDHKKGQPSARSPRHSHSGEGKHALTEARL
jgi:hypothetical protein